VTSNTFRECVTITTNRGSSFPLGATVCSGGVNFSVFSKNATSVELLLFDHADAPKPLRTVRLDPKENRTYHYWHVFIPDIQVGQIYGYRVHGPFEPERGMRFDPKKVLLDPYGKAVVIPETYNRLLASERANNTAYAMKSIVADTSSYNWEGDVPLKQPFVRTIVYEMHVRGFTIHPGSGVSREKRGTYAGLIEKIPYLKDLGITAVELLPVYQYDEQDAPAGFKNYWGYAPVSFFAPYAAYSSRKDSLGPLDEFRDMVKALHREGIEVILDVVYNHTAEGNHMGPTFCFRGLQNDAYYILESIGRFRLPVWIVAVSSQDATCQNLQFSYGVYPVHEKDHPENWKPYVKEWLQRQGITGDIVVLTEGPSSKHPEANHRMEIIDLRSS
jgi:isoamylase